MVRKGTLALALVAMLSIAWAASAAAAKGGKPQPTATPQPTVTPGPTPTPCAECPVMYVDTVTVVVDEVGGTLYGRCAVAVNDADGNRVAGAGVHVAWSGLLSGTGSALTEVKEGGDIYADIHKTQKGRCKVGVFATCTVTNVVKDGWRYAPELNHETSDDSDNGPGTGCGY